jgi:hypothetical protein
VGGGGGGGRGGLDLPARPPHPLFDEELDVRGIDGQCEDQHAGGDGPVMMPYPPVSDPTAVHLHRQTTIRIIPAL